MLCLLVIGQPARVLAAEGDAADTRFRMDASQGPITGSTRVVGLAGAYVAIAEGADGTAKNPASVAVRLPYSRTMWDYATSIDFAFGGWLPETDYLNHEDSESDVDQKSLLFGSLAGNVYYGHGGFGLSAEARRQALEREDATSGLAPTSLTANYGVVHLSLAYGFFDGQLVLGAGPRFTGLSLNGTSGSDMLAVAGIGAQAGAVVKPHDRAWRLGVVAKSAVTPRTSTGDSQGQQESGDLWRAQGVTLPWEVDLGVAYQFGPRALNPEFVSAEGEARSLLVELRQNVAEQQIRLQNARIEYRRTGSQQARNEIAELEAALQSTQTLADQAERRALTSLQQNYYGRPRHYLLVSAELVLLGRTAGSVALGSVASGVVDRSGEELAFSPRIGVESEVIANRLTLRGGSYLEPARSSFASTRVHGTLGCDVKLFHWDAFGLIGEFDGWTFSTAVDAAKDYLSTSFAIKFWH